VELSVGSDDGPFFDGGSGTTAPPSPTTDLSVDLRRVVDPSGREVWLLLRRVGYLDPDVGPILVPADLETWTTDLTSVPPFLTWLVPRTGAHLPAAILHDGLVLDDGEPASYIAPREVHRDEADRIFRDAMALTGTGLLRRWLVWAAVTVATMHHGRQVDWSPALRRYHRLVVWGTFLAIGVLGALATLDLLDVGGVRVPWMGEGLVGELVGGLAGAVAVPLLLGSLWGRFRVAGWIIGPLAAVVVPAIVPILVVGAAYVGLERLAARRPRVARGLALLVVLGAVAVTAWFVSR
jgi:hypothetical protein